MHTRKEHVFSNLHTQKENQHERIEKKKAEENIKLGFGEKYIMNRE